MNAPTLARPLRLHRPWPAHLLSLIADGLARWRQAVSERRQSRRAEAALLELSEATLRDMGAPQWLEERARVRGERERVERELLRHPREFDSSRRF